MSGTDILFKNEHQVAEMLRNGIHYREIGKTFGVSKNVVAYFCKLNNLQRGANKNSEADVARKIKDKSDGLLEYVSGYTIKEKPVRVRCLVCGGEFERTYHNITTKGCVTCPHCVELKRKARITEQERERAERKRKAEINKARNAKQLRMTVCPICGETFLTWKSNRCYCSTECRKESARRYASYNRGSDDRLNAGNIVDRDISLEKLFIRDKGVCQICGGLCDYNDYYLNENGTRIAGDMYPSRDHIVPLKQGGKHAWDNIRLAHRRCNTKTYWEEQRFGPSRSRSV